MERLRIEAEQYREGLEEKAAQVRLEYRKVAAEREATVDERLRITRLVGEATPAEQKTLARKEVPAWLLTPLTLEP